MLASLAVSAQTDTIRHIVDRGETIADISRKYGISEKSIIEANIEVSQNLYTGTELVVIGATKNSDNTYNRFFSPQAATWLRGSTLTSTPEHRRQSYIDIADNYFSRKKYKSAAKNYGYAIKMSPSATLYFNRAVSHYNRNKYNSAISDFRQCLEYNPDASLQARALLMIDKAEKGQMEKMQRRQEMAGAFFDLAVTGANMYLEYRNQQEQAKTAKKSGSSSSGVSSGDGDDDDYDADSGSSSSKSSEKSHTTCPSLKINSGKWYCNNTGECGMCGGDGVVTDYKYGIEDTHECRLCNGSGKCKYCQ